MSRFRTDTIGRTIALWIPLEIIDGCRHWERVIADSRNPMELEGIRIIPVSVEQVREHVTRGWFQRFLGFWRQMGTENERLLPNGATGTVVERRRRDAVLITSNLAIELTAELIRERWPLATESEKLGRNLWLVRHVIVSRHLEGSEHSPLRHHTGELRQRGAVFTTPEASKAVKDMADEIALLETLNNYSASPEECPTNRADPVDCTVFARPVVCRDDFFYVQVLAHKPEDAAGANQLASEFDEDAKRRGYTSLELDVEYGNKLHFHLSMPGSNIETVSRSLVWRAVPSSVQFAVFVPLKYANSSLPGTVTVLLGDLPVGQVTFHVKVADAKDTNVTPLGCARTFEILFISYSSKDRAEVLKRVQILRTMRKRVFQDLLDLDPGERWRKKLYKKIDESDAVLLFWSHNAKESEWVMRECRYAIDTKGLDCILPVIIEGPPIAEPPPELADLHMSDWLVYVLNAERRSEGLH